MAIIMAAMVAFSMVAVANSADPHPIRVRWCPEDAVHVGRGDFDGTRWDRYVCIPRDDIVEGGFR